MQLNEHILRESWIQWLLSALTPHRKQIVSIHHSSPLLQRPLQNHTRFSTVKNTEDINDLGESLILTGMFNTTTIKLEYLIGKMRKNQTLMISHDSTSSGSVSGVNLSPTLIPPQYSFSWLTTLYDVGKRLPSSKTGSREMLYEPIYFQVTFTKDATKQVAKQYLNWAEMTK